MQSIFSDSGLLAQALPSFEHRPGQVQMAEAVSSNLDEGGIALIEAGTGVGKSLAYLIPAARCALEHGLPVIVSTYTISLQEQLIYKDIPLLQSHWESSLRAVLAKGWGNYACLLRLENARRTPSIFDTGGPPELEAIARWVEDNPGDGSRQSLDFEPSTAAWDQVCAEPDTCLRSACPHYDACFVFRARRDLERAHLIVVNHHLLLTDVAVRQAAGFSSEEGVLPRYEHLVVDEAHHLEDVATSHLGTRLSERGIDQFLRRLDRRDRRRGPHGLVARVRAAVALTGESAAPTLSRLLEEGVVARLPGVRSAVQQLFESVRTWAANDAAQPSRRIRPDDATWTTPAAAAHSLAEAFEQLGDGLASLGRKLHELDDDEVGLAQEVEAMGWRASNYARTCMPFAEALDPAQVYWVEGLARPNERLHLCASPLQVGETIRSWLVDQLTSITCCSATLSLDGSFNYTRERLGLDAESVTETIVPSPFDYGEQARLLLPDDLPEPGAADFGSMLASAISRLVVATSGRAFVLFTSYALLDAVRMALTPTVEKAGLRLFVQGDAPRSRLLASFRTSGNGVLLGVDSFWEGVDVPGEELSVVAITRLPFEVPSDPVVEARSEWLALQDRNPFTEYALPRAALRLKQGFGRLIRHAGDRGAVVVYDRRVLTRWYGRLLLSVLPQTPVWTGHHEELVDRLAEWL